MRTMVQDQRGPSGPPVSANKSGNAGSVDPRSLWILFNMDPGTKICSTLVLEDAVSLWGGGKLGPFSWE